MPVRWKNLTTMTRRKDFQAIMKVTKSYILRKHWPYSEDHKTTDLWDLKELLNSPITDINHNHPRLEG